MLRVSCLLSEFKPETKKSFLYIEHNYSWVPYSNVLRLTIQTCIYKIIINKNGKDIALSVYFLKMIETDTVLQRILNYDFFQLLLYSYFYNCDVVETCFVGLTVIKPITSLIIRTQWMVIWYQENSIVRGVKHVLRDHIK